MTAFGTGTGRTASPLPARTSNRSRPGRGQSQLKGNRADAAHASQDERSCWRFDSAPSHEPSWSRQRVAQETTSQGASRWRSGFPTRKFIDTSEEGQRHCQPVAGASMRAIGALGAIRMGTGAVSSSSPGVLRDRRGRQSPSGLAVAGAPPATRPDRHDHREGGTRGRVRARRRRGRAGPGQGPRSSPTRWGWVPSPSLACARARGSGGRSERGRWWSGWAPHPFTS